MAAGSLARAGFTGFRPVLAARIALFFYTAR